MKKSHTEWEEEVKTAKIERDFVFSLTCQIVEAIYKSKENPLWLANMLDVWRFYKSRDEDIVTSLCSDIMHKDSELEAKRYYLKQDRERAIKLIEDIRVTSLVPKAVGEKPVDMETARKYVDPGSIK